MNRRVRGLLFTIPGVVIGFVGALSCDQVGAGPIVDPLIQCGFVCPDAGVAEGNGSISGIASIDAFFGSCVQFQAQADIVSNGITAELNGIAASVGANLNDTADLKMKLAAKLQANVDGALKVNYQPPKCTVSAQATLQAQAKCDASVKPGSASVQCQGSCTVDAGVMVDCGANAKLSCTGTAPNLQCSGSCQGDCDLKVAASCTGTCHGMCMGNCSAKDSMNNCNGSCDGMCQGTCSLQAGGTCSGSCKGQCTYTPPMAMCDASAQAHCDAMAGAKVDCKGSCTGQVTPPSASAECEASAKANASISADCKPPSLDVSFKLNAMASGDAMATAQFQAWVEGFKGHVSAILAYKAKLDGLTSAGGDIAANAQAAIKGALDSVAGTANLKVKFGAACAIKELPNAVQLVGDAATKLTASGQAAVDVLGSVGVS